MPLWKAREVGVLAGASNVMEEAACVANGHHGGVVCCAVAACQILSTMTMVHVTLFSSMRARMEPMTA